MAFMDIFNQGVFLMPGSEPGFSCIAYVQYSNKKA